jgi:hypothetical protein
VVEGENVQSVKNNRHLLVDQWCHCSSDRAQQLRVDNEWSAELKPTVFQKALHVDWESTDEGMGEGTEGDDKPQTDEDEQKRYCYKDPVIQLLCCSGGGGDGDDDSMEDDEDEDEGLE